MKEGAQKMMDVTVRAIHRRESGAWLRKVKTRGVRRVWGTFSVCTASIYHQKCYLQMLWHTQHMDSEKEQRFEK